MGSWKRYESYKKDSGSWKRYEPIKQSIRGPDKKPRKLRRKIPPKIRIQLSLTPENAEHVRVYPGTNSGLINRLLTRHRNANPNKRQL